MRDFIIYLSTIVALCYCNSCSLKEQYVPVIHEDSVQFVGHLINFNNVDVTTKASQDYETIIYTAYFLLFDNDTGERKVFTEVTNTDGSFSHRVTDLWVRSAKACFIANVPKSFVEGIDTVNELSNAVLENISYSSTFGVPGLDHDENSATSSLPCIPMFGSIDLTGETSMTSNNIITIPIQRLFAKVSVNLSLNVDVDWNLGDLWGSTIFKLNSCTINNLPKKVRLMEPSPNFEDSPWNTEDPSVKYSAPINSGGVTITNNTSNSNYTLSFYVPEYYLQSLTKDEYISKGYEETTYATQRYKPKMFDPNKYPIYLDLKGFYEPTSGNDVTLQYLIYLGENERDNFTLKRNRHYKNTLSITGVRYSMDDEVYIDHRVKTEPELGLDEITGETANCYLICDEGTYYFPAVKGAYKSSSITEQHYCTEGRVVVIAKDNTEIGIENCSFNPIEKTIVFDVTKVADGNAVIALLDDSNQIQWSWHLWMNTGFQLFGSELTEFELDIHDLSSKYKLINMNLGAKSGIITLLNPNDPIGTYYRPGFRQPYFNNVLTDDPNLAVDTPGYGYHGGLNDKTTWSGDAKSSTDPCPPGYRVPSTDAWAEFSSSNMYNDAALGGFLFYRSGLTNIYYPYSGAVNEGNRIIDGTEGGKQEKNYNKEMLFPSNQSYVLSNPKNTTAVKYTSIKYNEIDIDNEGYLLARNDEKVLRYGVESEGLEIVSCIRWTTTKWIHHPRSWTNWVEYWEADYGDSGATKKEITGAELKEYNMDHLEDILYEINGGFWGSIGDWIGGYFETVIFEPSDITSNYGYQIRCEVEQ